VPRYRDVDAFLASLAGVAVGGAATYWTQRSVDKRREKRDATQAVARLYDDAIAAVATVEAARWGPGLRITTGTFPAVSAGKMKETIEHLETETLKCFLDAKLAARAALAALHPYSSDLKRFWDKNEAAGQEDFDELISLLAERRRQLFEVPPDGHMPWRWRRSR
jgi:hypothetical protein